MPTVWSYYEVSLVGLSAEAQSTATHPCRQGGSTSSHQVLQGHPQPSSPPGCAQRLLNPCSWPDPQERMTDLPPPPRPAPPPDPACNPTMGRVKHPGVAFIRAAPFLLESPEPASLCLSIDLAGMSRNSGGAGSVDCQEKMRVRMGVITHWEARGPLRACDEQRPGTWPVPGVLVEPPLPWLLLE